MLYRYLQLPQDDLVAVVLQLVVLFPAALYSSSLAGQVAMSLDLHREPTCPAIVTISLRSRGNRLLGDGVHHGVVICVCWITAYTQEIGGHHEKSDNLPPWDALAP